MLERLENREVFDLLVIGGGATGCGIALDAASRGLKVALAEKGDFGSGTSSKSTKLIHGGLRYLERALLRLDRVDFNLVRDALRERAILLRIAPHLSRPLPFIIPIYQHSEMLYFLAGVKLYDFVAGSAGIGASKMIGRDEVCRLFPMLRREGLRGGVLYYDGQFDDARMNLALALTALDQGGALAGYLEVVELVRDAGKVIGARVREFFSGRSWEIKARCVINACGPSLDFIRQLDNPDAKPMLKPSLGSHIVLPGGLTPRETAITIPRTSDGRVLFVIPWKGKTLVGTTDRITSLGREPEAGEEDVQYLLGHLSRYFDLGARPAPILASWAGLRPLLFDPSIADSARLHRDHLIECSLSGLITIAGGKWTTYRKMAQDTVDFAIRVAGLSPSRNCHTDSLILHGGEIGKGDWHLRSQSPGRQELPPDCVAHLQDSYGDRAEEVMAICDNDLRERLVPDHPYLKGEVVYAVRHEMALRVLDFLERRSGLALVDSAAARAAGPKVLELMAAELGWDGERLRKERQALEKRFPYSSSRL